MCKNFKHKNIFKSCPVNRRGTSCNLKKLCRKPRSGIENNSSNNKNALEQFHREEKVTSAAENSLDTALREQPSIMPSAKYSIGPVDIKQSSKSSSLQRFCTSPKLWLSPNKTTARNNSEKYANISVRNVGKRDDAHIYENVQIKVEKSRKTNENVTVIQIPYVEKKSEEKLKIVIENFDKILTEFGPGDSVKTRAPPKLQKSKTCSIIESKCILKKSLSNPAVLDDDSKSNLIDNQLTKSLSDMDFDSSFKMETLKTITPIPPARKHVIKSDTFTKSTPGSASVKMTTRSTSVDSGKKHGTPGSARSASSVRKPTETSSTKSKYVTEIEVSTPRTSKPIQKTFGGDKTTKATPKESARNSTTPRTTKPMSVKSTPDIVKTSTPLKPLSIKSPGESALKPTSIPLPISRLSKAKSAWDVSLSPKYRPSKIPVKSLSKTLSPSIPSGLNGLLDRRQESMKDLQEVMKLQEKIAQQEKLLLEENITRISYGASANLRRVRSVANNIGYVSESKTLDKCITTGNRILKKVEALNEPAKKHAPLKKTISVKNVVEKIESASRNHSPDDMKMSSSNCFTFKEETAKNVTRTVTKSAAKLIQDELLKHTSSNCFKAKDERHKILSKTVNPFEEKSVLSKDETDYIKPDRKAKSTIKIDTDTFKKSQKPNLTLVEITDELIPKTTFGSSKQNFEALFSKSTDSLKSLDSQKSSSDSHNSLDSQLSSSSVDFETSFCTKNIRNSDAFSKNATHKSAVSEKLKLNVKTAKEITESVKFVTVENLRHPIFEKQDKARVKIERVSSTLKDKEVKMVTVKNDGLVKRNYSNIIDSHLILNAVSKDKCKDYNSDDSDDSGNISNDLDLDCEIEEDTVLTTCDTSKLNEKQVVSDSRPQIFFRPGVLGQLEALRDERLQGRVVSLQAHCRGYLARKRLGHRRLQDLAVRCIQRNVRKFMLVRDWPWWRLLVRVTPLLNVHRTEEQLRIKTEELEVLRAKVDKLEQERTSLKHDNDKLEGKLSEMTADLAEEHSTSTLATERLDAETQERLRLERELSEVQNKNRTLQQASERLEMELLYARSDLNGLNSEEDEDGEADGGVYKQRYERVARELEFTRRRLQQQHEDDLEQLVGLKKQLEKKLADAYEEVEEQRQIVGQWKRKVQKMNAETNDLRLLLEEQNARNSLLEKKQRKFDSETQLLHDELRQEKQAKDRLAREKEVVLAEKYTLENNLADTRLELELQTEKLHSLQRELDEITFGGKTEEEVTLLRKQKMELERKLHEQEEELDELAGQTQLLEQTKLRLEMSLEQARKEAKRETQQRDEELEEVRCNAQKKVKALEAQLENEHEERTLLLREKHELERRLNAAHDAERNERAGDEALLQRLKRDLRRTKALLRDAQTMLERQKADSPGKAVLRQLRHQLEDAECARVNAAKAKQSMEIELSEAQAQFEEAQRQRTEAEERANHANRERTELRTQLEENEEELAEVLKKYKAAVQQMSVDQLALQEQVSLVSELEGERNSLKEQLAELTIKLESIESLGDPTSNLLAKRMELRCKELESKLELEQTTRSRLEVQIARLKENVDKLQTEVAVGRTKEQMSQETIRKLQRSLRELRDEFSANSSREAECLQKRKELEKKIETADAETSAAKADLRLAMKRIEDLQSAIQGELEDTISDNSDSEHDSYSSDESIETFLANHKITPSKSSDRNSLKLDASPH